MLPIAKGAQLDQALVNQGQGSWKNDPASVSKALATTFLSWKHPLIARILSGGGARDGDATVQVQEVLTQQGAQISGPTVTVTLSRLEGKTRNIWIAIGAQDGTAITLTNLPARSVISSPVPFKGAGDAFESTKGEHSLLTKLSQRHTSPSQFKHETLLSDRISFYRWRAAKWGSSALFTALSCEQSVSTKPGLVSALRVVSRML